MTDKSPDKRDLVCMGCGSGNVAVLESRSLTDDSMFDREETIYCNDCQRQFRTAGRSPQWYKEQGDEANEQDSMPLCPLCHAPIEMVTPISYPCAIMKCPDCDWEKTHEGD